ncbi:hypothetical protein [Candidatus Chloroploca sp. Khr17]|uniref:hypothetical protein n=1 Tax=Candidatus Chloroploca sp. Khr17 TaxID=2496869 RepID=UPI00101D7BEA|nr:hypothetical protein [Candidatus Chloroploca sp. Khr17]
MEHNIVAWVWRRLTAIGVIVVALASFGLVGSPPVAYACSCVPVPPPRQAFEEATAVFSGRVVSIVNDEEELLVTVALERRWKSELEGQVTLTTPGSSAACGFPFEEGEQYLIYAQTTDGQLTTDLCSRTARFDATREDRRALGSGIPISSGAVPVSAMTFETPWLPIGLSLLALVIGVVIAIGLWRKR